MKKILIIINTIILCFTLLSCSKEKDEILYKDEIIDEIYSSSFYRELLFMRSDVAGPLPRGNNKMNILSVIYIDLKNKFYEGKIVEKKVIAGFYNDKTIEKIYNVDEIFRQELSEYYISKDGFSNIHFAISYILQRYPERNINVHDFDVKMYSFDDGIPLKYNDMKLGFVLNYYKIKLHTGREIVTVGYCLGDVYNDKYYPQYMNIYEYEPLDYGELIYQEIEQKNVIDYHDFYYNIIYKYYDTEYQLTCVGGEYADVETDIFNFFKPALSEDTPTKEFECGQFYKYDYDKLKELLVK